MPEISAEHNVIEYSVSEVAGAIKRVVEDAFGHIRLRGELSGYKGPHSSGHCYFSLKDESAVISAVMWKGNFGRLNFKPEDGLEVVVRGKVTTYPGRSNYQIVVESMEPAGVGALMALLEKRKAQLAAEGLFDPARKQELPFLPEVIGVVTSPTGAVIRDILHRLSDRFPRHVIVWPVAVQGEGAAAQIAAAINGFQNFEPKPDLLIVARGGGSIEDLWAFNEEVVVRAAANSFIPLISAVGHETDTTLIDYASDKRAPTPTAAAEMAVPVREEWRLAMVDFGQRMARGMLRSLTQKTENLNARARMLPRLLGKADQATQRLDDWSDRLLESLPKLLQTKAHLLGRFRLSGDSLLTQVKRQEQQIQREGDRLKLAMERRLRDSGRKLSESSRMLAALDYQSVLERGFVLVRDAADERVVMRSGDVKDGQSLTLQFKDGKRTVRA